MHSSKVHRPGDIRILRKVAQLSRTEDYLSEANFFAMYGFLLTVVSRRCHDLFKYRVFLLQCSIRLAPKACGQPVVWAQPEVTFALSQKASGILLFDFRLFVAQRIKTSQTDRCCRFSLSLFACNLNSSGANDGDQAVCSLAIIDRIGFAVEHPYPTCFGFLKGLL